MTTWYLRDAQFNRTSKPSGKPPRFHLPSLEHPESARCAPVATLRDGSARGHIVLHEGLGEEDPPQAKRCKRCTRMFAAAIGDETLRRLIADSLLGRQNAHKRALRRDAEAALGGDLFCRFAIVEVLFGHRALTLRAAALGLIVPSSHVAK
jgi:hypothetical protein